MCHSVRDWRWMLYCQGLEINIVVSETGIRCTVMDWRWMLYCQRLEIDYCQGLEIDVLSGIGDRSCTVKGQEIYVLLGT